MQAIRLLEKQRREREAEEEYQRELEEIIERAEKIEIDTQLYIEDQQKKIEEVEHKKITITDCTNKKTCKWKYSDIIYISKYLRYLICSGEKKI